MLIVAFALAAMLWANAAPAQGKPGLDKATQALFDAVLVNDLEAVKASVSADADLEARDRWGMTPIDLAVDRGHFKIAHFLLSVRNFRRDKDADGGAVAEAPKPGTPAPQRTIGSTLGGTIGGTLGGTVGGPAPSPEAPPKPAASARLTAPPAAPAPPVPPEPRGVAAREIPPPGAEPPVETAARPQWPAGQPNPFDPQVAAPGSSLEIVGSVAQPEARPGLKPAPSAPPRPAPVVTAPRVPDVAKAEPQPAPAPVSKETSLPPEPVAPAAAKPETVVAAREAEEGGSERGFFGRMLGAIGLGGDETTAETPTPKPAVPSPRPPFARPGLRW